ncbi:hypothetical protein NC652_009539 [Populus alba x Populus x berolinensis]|nr:hypothetical protein NC652_009539 [Populus alba x Populus x berolinensis]
MGKIRKLLRIETGNTVDTCTTHDTWILTEWRLLLTLGHNSWVNFKILAWRGGTPMRLCCWREDLEKWKLLISGSFTGVEDCDFDEVWGNCGGG